ncbi:MAG: hypothetical protein WBL79_05680 [Bacillota bacterium]|jgi:cell division septum initiation protein DivIVA|nr:hypothetical protein [Bacillota bacterium]HOB42452.1 hypothetical protein [Bacillota bacterium]HOK70162.1 hypothetical protein [Bacillota bacterium]HOL51862.1 hypothetical protein [Bacillota bacterium]HOO29579.1 hypothetical protein [Bacillota bacterium]
MIKQSVVECLNRMETIIESSGKLPFSGKRAVDGVELLELIDRIRIALPEEMRQTEALIAERSRLAAEDGVGIASAQASGADGEVFASAREEAEVLLMRAEREAMEIRLGADDYAEATLASLQETLDRTSFVVRKGIEELRRRKDNPEAR